MKIPDKYTEIYSRAKEIDFKLENSGGGIFTQKRLVAKNVEWIILCEKEINDLKKKIITKQNDIQTAMLRLKENGIEVPIETQTDSL